MKTSKNLFKNILVVLLLQLFVSFSFARSWQKIDIPGAKCGNGEQYSVYVSHKDPTKLVVEFMGGGACWSEKTCYGRAALTSLEPLRQSPKDTPMLSEDMTNPLVNHSVLYFPYCTGDVFAGSHEAQYKAGIPLYHDGYSNVISGLAHIQSQGVLNFPAMNDVVVWGASAGAIGALLHAKSVDSYLSLTARRTLIADSPGLHFGKGFWQKFSTQMNTDFQNSFNRVGLFYSLDNGFIAPLMGPVFNMYNAWEIGILQSTKDTVMSIVFGGITPDAHRKLVLSDFGIAAIARGYSNVRTWIADVSTHTFLLKPQSADTRSMDGETAWNFAVRLYTEWP